MTIINATPHSKLRRSRRDAVAVTMADLILMVRQQKGPTRRRAADTSGNLGRRIARATSS